MSQTGHPPPVSPPGAASACPRCGGPLRPLPGGAVCACGYVWPPPGDAPHEAATLAARPRPRVDPTATVSHSAPTPKATIGGMPRGIASPPPVDPTSGRPATAPDRPTWGEGVSRVAVTPVDPLHPSGPIVGLGSTRVATDTDDARAAGQRAASEAHVPDRIGDFEIVRELGRGAMGVVYEAVQHPLGRRVALKVLPRELTIDEEAIARFHREASAVARLQHEGIVPVYQSGAASGFHYYAMEVIRGRSVSELIAEQGALPPHRAVEIAREAARALAHAHDEGILHRDVKPSNLMVGDDGRVRLTDFGLAKRKNDARLTGTGMAVGTPAYMSPEQAYGDIELGPECDIYSLGATLYELSTGRNAFSGKTINDVLMKVINEDPVPPRAIRPNLHKDIETVILKAMAKEVDKRYRSAHELAADLERILAGDAVAARRETILSRFVRKARRNRTTVLGLGVATFVLLLAVGIGALVWRNHRANVVTDAWQRFREIGAVQALPTDAERRRAAAERLAAYVENAPRLTEPADRDVRANLLRLLDEGLADSPASVAAYAAAWLERHPGDLAVTIRQARAHLALGEVAALAPTMRALLARLERLEGEAWNVAVEGGVVQTALRLVAAAGGASSGLAADSLAALERVESRARAGGHDELVSEVLAARAKVLLDAGRPIEALAYILGLERDGAGEARLLVAQFLVDAGGQQAAARAERLLAGQTGERSDLIRARAADTLCRTAEAVKLYERAAGAKSRPEDRRIALIGRARNAALLCAELDQLLVWISRQPDEALLDELADALGESTTVSGARDIFRSVAASGKMVDLVRAVRSGERAAVDEIVGEFDGRQRALLDTFARALPDALDPSVGKALEYAREAALGCDGSPWEAEALAWHARILLSTAARRARERLLRGEPTEVALDARREQEVSRLLARATELAGRDPRTARAGRATAFVAQAEHHLVAGRLEQARRACEAAIAAQADHPEAWGMLAALIAPTGETSEARRVLAKARAFRRRDRIYALYGVSGSLLFRRSFGAVTAQSALSTDALRTLARLGAENPWFAEVPFVRARYFARAADVGRTPVGERSARWAVEDFEQALRIDDELAVAHFEVARLLADLGEFDSAVGHLERVPADAVGSTDTLYELGKTLVDAWEADPRDEERLRQAIETFGRAAEAGHPTARRALQGAERRYAQWSLERGDRAAADTHRRAADAEWARFLEERRERLVAPGRPPEAIDAYLEAKEHADAKRWGEAYPAVKRALDLDHEMAEAYALRAEIVLKGQGDLSASVLDECRAWIRRPDELADKFVFANIDDFGGLGGMIGRAAERAVEASPEDPVAWFALGAALRFKDDPPDLARVGDALGKALALDPERPALRAVYAITRLDEYAARLLPDAEGGNRAAADATLLDEAGGQLEELLRGERGLALGHYGMARLRGARGDAAGAREAAQRALAGGFTGAGHLVDDVLLVGLRDDELFRGIIERYLADPQALR